MFATDDEKKERPATTTPMPGLDRELENEEDDLAIEEIQPFSGTSATAVEVLEEEDKTSGSDSDARRSSSTGKEDAGVPPGLDLPPRPETPAPPYSTFTNRQKIAITLTVSFLAIISPLSGQVYLPALNAIADDLHVPVSDINLTITTFMIFQGIAPSFIGNLSDVYGRRPAYLICFSIYVLANLGLALQNSYAALMVLRCFQSMGSSATISLSSATVADLVTRAERGKFIGFAAMGVTLGPALGPVAGGLLTQYFGWHGIFWFLLILSSVLFMFGFLPEPCRNIVGNASVYPPWWNLSVWQYVRARRLTPAERAAAGDHSTLQRGRRRPNPFAAMRILLEKEGGVTLGCGALLATGYFMVLTTFSEQLKARFGFNPVVVGLCYLPLGFGTLTSRWTIGLLLDWNFRRWARKLRLTIDLNKQQNLDVFPIEKIRLQISLMAIYLASVAVIAYGWTMERQASLAGIEIALFFMGVCFAGAMNGINTLIVDTHPESPATAVAANNLFRCFMSAGGSAIANPLIARIGMGFTSVLIAGVWVGFSPILWVVMFRGAAWRAATKAKQDRKKTAKALAASGV
ncbi:Major facilitator superfamily domain, general substrate transporter [Niveomyces insectorum RCEF 264]|uniref:Major facilitator superfamily domain, general substrate transporter n=1 Tax=Niveomyces insectorum RCEF 264 TaxID=1081102 RepID=A0A167SH60_9HYPO|nr:Major facilitator superfamily domain, general substrate transporter [Niveomyces insectorum RCEF 264]